MPALHNMEGKHEMKWQLIQELWHAINAITHCFPLVSNILSVTSPDIMEVTSILHQIGSYQFQANILRASLELLLCNSTIKMFGKHLSFI